MQAGQRHVYRHDGGVDRYGESQHEKLVQGLPALPDQSGKRKGRHQRDGQRDDDRRDRHDRAVQKVPGHIPRFQRAGIIRPQPFLRKPDDIFAEYFRIALQGERKHPIDRKEVDKQPEYQSDVNDDARRFGVVSHNLISPYSN